MGKEEENSGFEARKKELEDGGIEKPGQEENRIADYLKGIESINIWIPEPEKLELPNYPEKIKIVELSGSKHLEFERLMNKMDMNTVNDVKDFKNMTFDQVLSFASKDWDRVTELVIAICNNGMNVFVNKEFCDNYLSQSLALKIVHTYVMKFFIPVFIQRMQMQSFYTGVLVLSGPRIPKTGSGIGS